MALAEPWTGTRLEDVAGTFLERLPGSVADALLEDSRTVDVRRGALIFDAAGLERAIAVLVRGAAKASITAADGRQLAVRYARPGTLIGMRSELSGDHAPLTIRAVTDCRVLELNRRTFDRMVRATPELANVVISELTRRLEDVYLTIADTIFGSMRQRVARHLLSLAEPAASPGTTPIVTATQQELADGVGTSREVVARMLGALRREGVVRTSPRAIEILDVGRLTSFLGEWRTQGSRIEHDLSFEAERLLEASPNPVLAVDAEGTIVFANSSVETVFGWPARDVVGQAIEELVPIRVRETHAGLRAAFQVAPQPRPMGLGRALQGRRRDGTEFPLAASLTPIDTRDGILVIATVVELTPPAVDDPVLAVPV